MYRIKKKTRDENKGNPCLLTYFIGLNEIKTLYLWTFAKTFFKHEYYKNIILFLTYLLIVSMVTTFYEQDKGNHIFIFLVLHFFTARGRALDQIQLELY